MEDATVWKIDQLEVGESVLAVAPILEGGDFDCRLVLTDRRIITIRSPAILSMLGLARYANSSILTAISLNELKSVEFTSSAGGFASSLVIESQEGVQTYQASGIGTRWLRLLSAQIPNPAR